MDRNLDGVWFRVQRNGKWGNACFSDLTEVEMDQILQDRDAEWLKGMCKILGMTIRKIGEEFELVAE